MPTALEDSKNSKQLLDFLKAAYVQDDEVLRVPLEKCGWRSLVQIARGTGLPINTLYGKRPGDVGHDLLELTRANLIELRYFKGERGRGGEVMRCRIAMQQESRLPPLLTKAASDAEREVVDASSERKLAAIMFTDMVGYTALGQRNESLALALLNEERKLIRPILDEHNGKEIKTMGDSFLVEFPNALDAVRCGYDIQRKSREFNLSLPREKRVALRIGIHVGDVVEDSEGDILGDAVNVASRIQSLAQEGGVCLTQQVFDHVHNKFELPLKSLGKQSLKNVRLPVEVYTILMPWGAALEDAATVMTELDRRRIVVLPFTNISPSSGDEYFADGMTDELISTISKIRDIRVIARTSAMKYKGSKKSAGEIGEELKVGAVLEGTVRKAGNKLRITTQLIDAQKEEPMWSESYDRDLQDVFALQSEIAQRVSEALKIKLVSAEREELASRPTQSSEAHNLYLKGRFYWSERSQNGNDKAVKYFEAAINLDPRYALAYAGLADCYLISADYGWRRPSDCYPRTADYATRAIEIDPRLAEGHATRAWVYTTYEWRWSDSEREFRTSLELDPSYATAYQWYALYLTYSGRLGEALVQIKRARELDPLSRVFALNEGMILTVMDRKEEATELCKKIVAQEPDYADGHRFLGFMNYLNSQNDEAIEEARRAVDISNNSVFMRGELATLLGLVGRHGEARKILDELESLSKTTYVPNVEIAQVLFALGRVDEAFSYLKRAEEDRSSRLLWFSIWPWFKEFRNNPIWHEIESRIGIARGFS